MKACETCHVKVQTQKDLCPLCGTGLAEATPPANVLPVNHYPDLSGKLYQYGLVRRVLLFASLLGCGISILVNLLATPGFWWWIIVVAVNLYCWITIPPLLRRNVNYASRVLPQVIFTSALMIGIDLFVGYRGWSVSYVVPSLLCAGIAAIGVVIMFNRTRWTQYIWYQVLMGVFGFIPLVLYFFGLAQNLVMVIITASLALASLLATIVFGDRSLKSEFKRRFHL